MASKSMSLARRVAAVAAPAARAARASTASIRVPGLARALATRAEVVPSKKGKQDKSLTAVLERELEYEKEDNNTEQTLKELAESLEGWTIHDEPGTARFAVTRKWGTQTLRVDVDCTPMPGEEEEFNEEEEQKAEEDEGPMDGYRMLVSVGAEGKPSVMQIGCFVTDHLRIHRVAVYADSKVAPSADQVFGGADEIATYGGPNFDELDQAVQNGFYEYLADRGIDDGVAEKLGDYAAAKEQAEYMRWLSLTKDLVK